MVSGAASQLAPPIAVSAANWASSVVAARNSCSVTSGTANARPARNSARELVGHPHRSQRPHLVGQPAGATATGRYRSSSPRSHTAAQSHRSGTSRPVTVASRSSTLPGPVSTRPAAASSAAASSRRFESVTSTRTECMAVAVPASSRATCARCCSHTHRPSAARTR